MSRLITRFLRTNVPNSRTMFSIQEQCSQFKSNVLNSRTMFSIQEQCSQFKNNVLGYFSLCIITLFFIEIVLPPGEVYPPGRESGHGISTSTAQSLNDFN